MEDRKIGNGSKRKLVEIAEETARKMQLFCFLKDVRMNYFATKAIERELKPYESQIENIRKFKLDYSN